jgi:hypothetical protein
MGRGTFGTLLLLRHMTDVAASEMCVLLLLVLASVFGCVLAYFACLASPV